MPFISDGAVLSGMITPASHLVQRSRRCKIVNLWTKTKSHSTCWLKVSGRSMLHALLGPGFAQARQTLHVETVSGMRSSTFWDADSVEESFHRVRLRVPPTYVELP